MRAYSAPTMETTAMAAPTICVGVCAIVGASIGGEL